MLKKLANIFSYTLLATIFGILTGIISVICFGVFYSTTDIMFREWPAIYRTVFAIMFFSMPLFITLSVICALRARKENEKFAIIGMLFACGPTFYGGAIFLLFVLIMIAYLS